MKIALRKEKDAGKIPVTNMMNQIERHNRKRNSEKGFTLIEVLFSMGIIVIAVIGIIAADIMIQKNSESAHESAVALQDASRVVEQIRLSAFGASVRFPADVVTSFPNSGLVAGFANLTQETVRVTYTDPTANPLAVTVTVNWISNQNRNSTVALRSLVTQRQ